MRDHMDGCANQYRCTSYIYLLSCLALIFSIIIDIEVWEPRNGKDVIDGLHCKDKRMLKLEISKLLHTELIRDDPNFFKFMQVHVNEEYQSMSLAI